VNLSLQGDRGRGENCSFPPIKGRPHSQVAGRRQTIFDRYGLPIGKADISGNPHDVVKKKTGFLKLPSSCELTSKLCVLKANLSRSKQKVTNARNAYRLAHSQHKELEGLILPEIARLEKQRSRRKSYQKNALQRSGTLDASWGY